MRDDSRRVGDVIYNHILVGSGTMHYALLDNIRRALLIRQIHKVLYYVFAQHLVVMRHP